MLIDSLGSVAPGTLRPIMRAKVAVRDKRPTFSLAKNQPTPAVHGFGGVTHPTFSIDKRAPTPAVHGFGGTSHPTFSIDKHAPRPVIHGDGGRPGVSTDAALRRLRRRVSQLSTSERQARVAIMRAKNSAGIVVPQVTLLPAGNDYSGAVDSDSAVDDARYAIELDRSQVPSTDDAGYDDGGYASADDASAFDQAFAVDDAGDNGYTGGEDLGDLGTALGAAGKILSVGSKVGSGADRFATFANRVAAGAGNVANTATAFGNAARGAAAGAVTGPLQPYMPFLKYGAIGLGGLFLYLAVRNR